jgi:hypothetical protein
MNGGLPPQTGSRRLVLGKLLALGLICGALIISTNAPARSCPVTDVDCVVDKARDTVGGAQGTIDETVEDAASDAGETFDKVTGEAGDDVGSAIEDIVGTPDNFRPDPVSDPVVTSDPGSGPVGARVRGPLGSGSRAQGDPGVYGAGGSGPGTNARLAVARAAASDTAPAESAASVAQSTGPTESGLTEVIRRFAFPLILSALVGVFLFLQDRVDRRDRKLALAPLDTEMILFE